MDIKTLVMCNFLINLVNVFVLANVWRQNRTVFDGLHCLMLDMALQASGFLLLLLRGVLPDAVTMVVPNVFFILGALTVLYGLERFFGLKSRYGLHMAMMALYIAALFYLGLIAPNLALREIVISFMIAFTTAQIAWLLGRRIEASFRRMARFTLFVFILYVTCNVIRMALLMAFPPQTSDFFKSHALDAAFIGVYLCLSVLVAMSLILLINRRLLEEMTFQKEKYQMSFQQVPYAILLTKLSSGEIIEVNGGFEQISGFCAQEAVGNTTLGLKIWLREEDRAHVVEALSQNRPISNYQMHFRHKNGSIMTGLMSSSVVTIHDEKCMLTTVSDITEQSRLNEKLHDMALRDGLTGLSNRSLFYDRFALAAATALREGRKMAILIMDLDAFKAINDDYGHQTGDRVLIEVGRRLSGRLRSGDTVARFGGDEFIFLIWNISERQDLTGLIQRILDSFIPPVEISPFTIPVSLSSGVAMFPDDGTDIDELIRKADEAMYRVKETGKGSFAFYE